MPLIKDIICYDLHFCQIDKYDKDDKKLNWIINFFKKSIFRQIIFSLLLSKVYIFQEVMEQNKTLNRDTGILTCISDYCQGLRKINLIC